MQQAYREAALSLSCTSPTRPIASLDELSSLECAHRLRQTAAKTGYDPRTFAGLVELIFILETIDNDQQT